MHRLGPSLMSPPPRTRSFESSGSDTTMATTPTGEDGGGDTSGDDSNGSSPQRFINDYDDEEPGHGFFDGHGSSTTHAAAQPVVGRARAATTALLGRQPSQSQSQSQPKAQSSLAHGRMYDAVIAASEHTNKLLRREAMRATCVPIKLRHVRAMEQVQNDISVYQYKPKKHSHPATTAPQEAATTTRIFGVAQVHAPISEVVKIIGHKSALSLALLTPGLADYETIHTLVQSTNHYVAVKSVVMNDQWNAPHISRKREFILMESQQAFQTSDRRNGWLVSYHSLSYSSCPEPLLGAVRGSVYYSGIVALERWSGSEQIDLFTVAEYNLKGQVTSKINRQAARDRVVDTLVLLTGTIEQRAVTELSLLQSHDFNEIKKLVQVDVCRLCVDKIGVVPKRGAAIHRCRKCCVSVCASCSSIWKRGKKEMRLCMQCWAGTTQQF